MHAESSNDKLVRMANQISLFFASYPHDEGLAGVLNHLKLYWEPRIKTQIKEYVAGGGSGLHVLALEAVNKL